jgi:CheY-like chemotaxis protein
MTWMDVEARGEAPVIMIVDDDEVMRELLSDLLEGSGYRVVTAIDGRQALALLEQSAVLPSMLLLDLMMPVMNGWELAAAMRSHPVLSRVPIYIMSSLSSSRQVTLPAGIAGSLPKGAHFDLLLAVIRSQCQI